MLLLFRVTELKHSHCAYLILSCHTLSNKHTRVNSVRHREQIKGLDRPLSSLRQCNSTVWLPSAIVHCLEHFLGVCLKHSEKKIIRPIANNRVPSKSNLQLQISFLSLSKQIGSPKVPYIQMKTMQIWKYSSLIKHLLHTESLSEQWRPSADEGGGHPVMLETILPLSLFFFFVFTHIAENEMEKQPAVWCVDTTPAWRFEASS